MRYLRITTLQLYPQTINFERLKTTYRITNLLGKIITSGTITNNSVNISALKNGIYLIELTDKEEIFSQKFIKQ
jgi:hypothetical protein